MRWKDVTPDWGYALRHLKERFPYVDESELYEFHADFALHSDATKAIAEHVARRHDLTPMEAEEEVKDWLFIQSLARQASELDAG